MKNITNITKRDIFKAFENGIKEDLCIETEVIQYKYYGVLEEIEFLKRLYDLSAMESYDDSFSNAEEEIREHTVNNNAYPSNWVFKDSRFQLLKGEDDIFLSFICEIFNPEVRDESGGWELFLNKINSLLNEDGYELYPLKKISGRNIYTWRKYSKDLSLFIPFSQRNKEIIENKKLLVELTEETRYQIYQLIQKNDELLYLKGENNFEYRKMASELIFEEINQFYIPKNFEKNQYGNGINLKKSIMNTPPFTVFDVIEVFNLNISQEVNYPQKINTIFKLNKVNFIFKDGEIRPLLNAEIAIDSLRPIKDLGVEELLLEAEKFYNNNELSNAVEKMWDAFERIKTYYFPLDKKESANKIIEQLSGLNENIKEIFEKEFETLTRIGNNFRIRHHEKNKIDISDDKHYEYFYKRCLSLISVVVKVL